MGRSLGVGVGRGVTTAVDVGVAVAVAVTVEVALGVGVITAVALGVALTTGVAVGVALTIGVAVGVGVGAGSPPFVVQRIVPLSPTAIPRKPSLAKETSLRLTNVPLVWSLQVIPPSVLCEMRPPQPAEKPLVDCGKSIPWIT